MYLFNMNTLSNGHFLFWLCNFLNKTISFSTPKIIEFHVTKSKFLSEILRFSALKSAMIPIFWDLKLRNYITVYRFINVVASYYDVKFKCEKVFMFYSRYMAIKRIFLQEFNKKQFPCEWYNLHISVTISRFKKMCFFLLLFLFIYVLPTACVVQKFMFSL